ncbi:MAG: hypothetical protein ACRERC_00715 [Candidatus Binatia bacterium]
MIASLWARCRAARLPLATLCALCAVLVGAAAGQEVNPGLAGAVRYYSNDAVVAGVTVNLMGTSPIITSTDPSGAYLFADPGPGTWQVEPVKNGDIGSGVSTVDASHVLQAVVGLRQFTSEQLLACDVTGDGTVSSLDAARILQFVAGLRSTFPVADACGSDWVFLPDPLSAPNQRLIDPQMAPACAHGAIIYEPLAPPLAGQDFRAVLFGDCTGNWQPLSTPADTPTPTATLPEPPATAPPTATAPPAPTASQTPTAAATDTATAAPTATASPASSSTPTRTAPPTATATASGTSTRTSTATRTGTNTLTPSRTVTETRTATATLPPASTATATNTGTPSFTATATRTITATRTATPTWTSVPSATVTFTRTGTRTATPSLTGTPSPTPTPTCPNGLAWNLSPATLISAQTGGNLWLAKTVPTDTGWGIFWLRQDPAASTVARLYYAHINFSGQVTHGPLLVLGIPRIDFRGRYYLAAWNQGKFGLLIADRETLSYYNMALDGSLSGKKTVGPPLFTSAIYDQEADGDFDAYPDGFIGVVEGECAGHSCAYAFRLGLDGTPTSSVINLVDFDLTHQFYPRAAFDGAGFAVISVKDIKIATGGVLTKYWPLVGGIGTHAKVVPAKEYLWDEFPDLGWNGDHFAAVWTENSARSHQQPWQIRFATFNRTKTVSTLIGERIIDVVQSKTNHRWTTQVHPMGADWVAQYASRAADNSVVAVYELLGADAQTRAAREPFTLTADALGSSPHTAPGHVGTLGIARGSNLANGTEVTFHTMPPPTCQ